MPMHTLTLRLKADKVGRDLIERRFRMIWHIHNTLVKHMQHRLNALLRDGQYKALLSQYGETVAEISRLEKEAGPDKSRLRKLKSEKAARSKALAEHREGFLVSKTECESYVKVMQKRFKNHITSQQAQKEADFVWAGVEKVLYGNGKCLHMKRLTDQLSIQQKSAANGIKFLGDHITWCGMEVPVDISDDPYIMESLKNPLKYCILTRKAFRNGWHYYVVLYLDGSAPKKVKAGDGCHGIDPGMSTMCHVSGNAIGFHELAPDCRKYNREIARQQRLIDRQMRQENPGNYNPDGTVKKGQHTWKATKGCRRRKQYLRTLYRQKTEYTLHSHNRTLNRMLPDGASFIVGKMDYAALARRSEKKAVRQDKTSAVRRKDGQMKIVHKFQKKRRFGKSVNDRSPALFLARARQKAAQYGGIYAEIDTKAFRTSQYDHVTGTYHKIPRSRRRRDIGGHMVLRDAYNAFLIYCTNENGTAPDADRCRQLFPKFLSMQDALIAFTKDTPHPVCFGY